MSFAVFTLEEDLYALPSLLPTLKAEQRIGRLLQLIQMSSSRAQLDKRMEQITVYLQALEDLELLDVEQAVLLRELVSRARLRCALA